MAAEYIANSVQAVALNAPVDFTASIPCNRGWVVHDDGTGIFILRGIVNCECAKYASYQVNFNANIALPTGGTVAPIAVAITQNGEIKNGSRAIYTPAAVDEYGNVSSTTIVRVPRGCCYTIAINSVPASTDGTPAPSINVQNANLTISRIS